MRLSEDVALVGGGAYTGFGISADFDAHCYLLDGGDELALVDCGTGTEAATARLLANVEAAGCDPSRIARLFLTHFHTDHAGGAARYRERLGCAVAISAAAADALETADHEATSLAPGQRTGLFPAGFDYPPCPVADRLTDGDERRVGRLTVRFLATPGHCAGHGSYLVTGGERSYLFAGDAVFAWGKVAVLATADCDLQALLSSVRRLAGEEFDALLPGHDQIVLDGGKAHVEQAKATIDKLDVPPNWFS
jgi:glyoxylase-like metal-dependent hydrolase (beta-lactamase superfamily II)